MRLTNLVPGALHGVGRALLLVFKQVLQVYLQLACHGVLRIIALAEFAPWPDLPCRLHTFTAPRTCCIRYGDVVPRPFAPIPSHDFDLHPTRESAIITIWSCAADQDAHLGGYHGKPGIFRQTPWGRRATSSACHQMRRNPESCHYAPVEEPDRRSSRLLKKKRGPKKGGGW